MAQMIIYDVATPIESITFNGSRGSIDFEAKGVQDDVKIGVEVNGSTAAFYINQEQLKALIAHLQKQLI